MKNMVEKETIERPNVKKTSIRTSFDNWVSIKVYSIKHPIIYFHFPFCLDGFGNDEYTRGYHIGKNKDWQ